MSSDIFDEIERDIDRNIDRSLDRAFETPAADDAEQPIAPPVQDVAPASTADPESAAPAAVPPPIEHSELVARDARAAVSTPSNEQQKTAPTAVSKAAADPFLATIIDTIYDAQQQRRASVSMTTAKERIAKIRRLHDAVLAHGSELHEALFADYRKPAAEVDLSELFPVVREARHAMKNLRSWMQPKRAHAPLHLAGTRSYVTHEAKGVVLILSPWNFPVNLTLGPLVSAIAAGNCVMIKPSELTPNAAAWMKRVLGEVFDEDEVAVIEGDASVAEALLRKKFDHIFFTGSPAVGKIVMHAAAEHLTSVTLELGGKSPVIVDPSADLKDAARKIVWGKFFNGGQVCIAPDYVLAHESIRLPLIENLRGAIDELSATSEGAEAARGWIVNDRHGVRVQELFDDAVARGANVPVGGAGETTRTMPPTIITDVPLDARVMQEEIFGPILPVTGYRELDEAMTRIEERERPLVVYLFAKSREFLRQAAARTRAGGTVINDTMLHFFHPGLPFGGVGQSGMGRAHGWWGFEAFSNVRGTLEQRLPYGSIRPLYPPYTSRVRKLIGLALKWL
jgi:aldehyde dehydrogenase (NAD+)